MKIILKANNGIVNNIINWDNVIRIAPSAKGDEFYILTVNEEFLCIKCSNPVKAVNMIADEIESECSYKQNTLMQHDAAVIDLEEIVKRCENK